MIAEILGWEILVPLALLLIFFGGSKIPEIARSLGSAQSEFKKGLRDGADDDADKHAT